MRGTWFNVADTGVRGNTGVENADLLCVRVDAVVMPNSPNVRIGSPDSGDQNGSRRRIHCTDFGVLGCRQPRLAVEPCASDEDRFTMTPFH